MEGFDGAGMTVLRLPLGASDFSDREYSFADEWNDWPLNYFTLNNAPSYLWSVLADIKSVGPTIKIFAVPWSAPAWMKTTGTMKGGSLIPGYEATCECHSIHLILRYSD
jgi:O-glycosyl hydrolase